MGAYRQSVYVNRTRDFSYNVCVYVGIVYVSKVAVYPLKSINKYLWYLQYYNVLFFEILFIHNQVHYVICKLIYRNGYTTTVRKVFLTFCVAYIIKFCVGCFLISEDT